MASKALIQLVNDPDGTEIEDGKGKTVVLGTRQTSEIDLTTTNAERLREALSQPVGAGRRRGRMGRAGRVQQLRGERRSASGPDSTVNVPGRGRIR